MKVFCICITLCCISIFGHAQSSTDLRIANKYANSGQCDKAIELFETFEERISLKSYYTNFLKCLLSKEEKAMALQLVKKAQKKYPNQLKYGVDLGIVYKAKGEKFKAEKEFKKCVNALRKGRSNDVNILASKFSTNGEYEWLIKTFDRGQELNPTYEFGFQLATALANLGQTEQMIDTYLDLVEKNANHLRSVKIRLQNSLGRTKSSKDNYDLLQKKLLLKVQQTNNTTLTELLVWLHIQTSEYNAAYIYSKALDKRLKEDGSRLYTLANIAHENKAFKEAIKCYTYLINLGKNNPYYTEAKISEVMVLAEQITQKDYSDTELINLDQKYSAVINEFGKSYELAYLLKDYAKLKAFYLYDYDFAVNILGETISLLPRGQLLSECQLMLGDIYLIIDKDWDAILEYSKVEKENKENPLGHEAKFLRARTAYFQGQFDWAQAQLDVLKASTTKLIANNAMKLSLLITDNTGLDTSTTAMEMYAAAELLELQNKLNESYNLLDSLQTNFKGHTLTDEAMFKQANILSKQKKYSLSISLYEKIATDYAFDILADDALFKWAELTESHLSNKEKAKSLYEKLINDYSDSIYTTEARKRFRTLRGDENL
ncbi:MAG: tetratricopeptide repeat protein [Flavobacteriales bacterium]